jgi:hypothetical protein
MTIKKIIAILIAFSALSMNVAYAATGNNAPESSFFSNSWEKMSKSNSYQYSCKKTFGNVKPGANLSDSGQATVDLLKAATKTYKEKTESVLIAKDKKINAYQDKINTFDEMAIAKTQEEVTKSIKRPGKKSMSIVESGDTLYYNYANTTSSEKTGWKTFVDASSAVSFLDSFLKDPLTSGLNMYSFKFSSWKKSGKARSAVFSGQMTTEKTSGIVKFFTGGEQGYTYEPAKVQLTIDEKTGNWAKADVTATVRSTDPIYQVDIKQTCTFNFTNKVKVKEPKNAASVEGQAGLQELGTHASEF